MFHLKNSKRKSDNAYFLKSRTNGWMMRALFFNSTFGPLQRAAVTRIRKEKKKLQTAEEGRDSPNLVRTYGRADVTVWTIVTPLFVVHILALMSLFTRVTMNVFSSLSPTTGTLYVLAISMPNLINSNKVWSNDCLRACTIVLFTFKSVTHYLEWILFMTVNWYGYLCNIVIIYIRAIYFFIGSYYVLKPFAKKTQTHII